MLPSSLTICGPASIFSTACWITSPPIAGRHGVQQGSPSASRSWSKPASSGSRSIDRGFRPRRDHRRVLRFQATYISKRLRRAVPPVEYEDAYDRREVTSEEVTTLNPGALPWTRGGSFPPSSGEDQARHQILGRASPPTGLPTRRADHSRGAPIRRRSSTRSTSYSSHLRTTSNSPCPSSTSISWVAVT